MSWKSHLYTVVLSLALLIFNVTATRTTAWAILPQQQRHYSLLSFLHVTNTEETTATTSSNITYTYRSVSLYKPMGLVLEQDQESDEEGVKILKMSGAAARASQGGIIDLCIGDTVVKVGTNDCTKWSFDQIMEAIISVDENKAVDLTLRRPSDAIPVKFLKNGACIAAKPGMSIGALGFQAEAGVEYSCRNGGCGTCQHVMVTHGIDGKSQEQYVRPCVAKVPKGVRSLSIIPCDGYEGSCLLHDL